MRALVIGHAQVRRPIPPGGTSITIERVVVADPCPDNRDSLAELLRLYGFAAETADSLHTLLAHLRATPADAIVTERFGDAAQTCRAIRDVAPEVPVAFHTTQGRPTDVHLARALGCRHFLKAASVAGMLQWLAGRPGEGGGGEVDDGGGLDNPDEFVPDRVTRVSSPDSMTLDVCLAKPSSWLAFRMSRDATVERNHSRLLRLRQRSTLDSEDVFHA